MVLGIRRCGQFWGRRIQVCILLRNFNSDSHPFHLHGHLFEVVRVGDVEIKGAMRDSAIVDPGECSVMEVCFEADNPGVWPIHCHMTCEFEEIWGAGR